MSICRTIGVFCLISLFVGCGGGDSQEFGDASAVRDALVAKGVDCTGFRLVPVEDREMIQNAAADVAECDVDGESVNITIWKDNGQRDNYISVGEAFCPVAQAYGLTNIPFVVGNRWTVQPETETVGQQVADALGGSLKDLC